VTLSLTGIKRADLVRWQDQGGPDRGGVWVNGMKRADGLGGPRGSTSVAWEIPADKASIAAGLGRGVSEWHEAGDRIGESRKEWEGVGRSGNEWERVGTSRGEWDGRGAMRGGGGLGQSRKCRKQSGDQDAVGDARGLCVVWAGLRRVGRAGPRGDGLVRVGPGGGWSVSDTVTDRHKAG
jgi:hypothetical protein